MMSSLLGDVRNYTSMHVCTITEQDPRQVEVSSMPIEFTTGAVGRRLQYPGCGRSMRSHYRNPWSFYFNPTWSWHQKRMATSSSQLLTSLWSGGDNSMPGKQLNPQHPAPHQQHRKKKLEHLSPDRIKKDMEELIPVWLKHPKSSVFQYTTRVEGSSYSSIIKSDQQQQVPSV